MSFSKGKIRRQIIESDNSSISPKKIHSPAGASTGFEYVSFIVYKICYIKQNFFINYLSKDKSIYTHKRLD